MEPLIVQVISTLGGGFLIFWFFGGDAVSHRWLESRRILKLEDMENKKLLQLEEHKTRRIEALSKMSQEGQRRLMAEVPDWVDKNDPEEIEAWKKARAELN